MGRTYQQTVFSAPVKCGYSDNDHGLANALRPLEDICVADGGIETVRFLAMRGRDGQYANATKSYLVGNSAVTLEVFAGEQANTRVTIRMMNFDETLKGRFHEYYAGIPGNQRTASAVTIAR